MAIESRDVWSSSKSTSLAGSYASVMERLGFRRCKSDSNLCCHKSRSLYVLAKVDDLLIVGDAKLKKEFIEALSKAAM